jgi:N-acetylglucosaminyldiphosphoundecaprenol N-acetyl-beta-D-mannosaminyltransferase
VLSTLATRARLLAGNRPEAWVRTERPGDAGGVEHPATAATGTGPLRPPTEGPTATVAVMDPGVDCEVDVLLPDDFGDVDPPRPRTVVGGVPIDAIDQAEALDVMMRAVKDGNFLQVCTVNLDFLASARRDPEVATLLRDSELNVADGAPVVWLQRMLGHRSARRLAGSDLVPELMSRAAGQDARVFFLGGEGGAAVEAAERMVRAKPGLQVAGVLEPAFAPLEEMDTEEILRCLDESCPDIVLVALGHPKQDKWISRNRAALPASVIIGVGGTFDIIAQRKRRAPRWMQQVGLEWLFRFLQEPRRLGGRYLGDAWVLVAVLVPRTLWQRLRQDSRAGRGTRR